MRIRNVAGIIIFLLAGCAVQPAGESIVFETVDIGTTASEFPQREELVIESGEQWRELWTRLQRSAIPPKPLPAIDYSQSVILAVFAGEQPSGGYEIQIVRVAKVADAVIAYTRLTQPESSAAAIQLLTYPYHIIKMPKTGLPIRFQQTR